jgi:hypothetical protein
MNITPNEAEEELAVIRQMGQKTKRSLAGSGAYIFLIITGAIWLVGFLANQFLPGSIAVYIWIGISLLGSVIAVTLGIRLGGRVRSPSASPYVKRIIGFWSLLILYCIAVIIIAQPLDSKQVTMLIVLFMMIGQLAMGLLFSFTAVWWALPITALALIGYFQVPDLFYLWMGVLVGGGMITLGLYMRLKW